MSQSSYHDYVLWRLNEKIYAERFMPASIYIGCMILFGGTGNGLVLCVYKSGKQKSTANIFIFFLSVIDFLLCILVMPFKLFDVCFPLLYGLEWPCKLYEFVEISLSMIAVSMMICIAVDRYLIVSKPLKRFDTRKLRTILLICFIVGTVCSTPTLAVYGQSIVKTNVDGLVGTTCGVAQHMKGSVVTRVWYMFMYIVFVLTLVVLVVLYIKIWRSINTWKNTIIGETVNKDNFRMKPIFKRKNSNSEKPLIPFGCNKNVALRSFYNPYNLANEIHEIETFRFDQTSENTSVDTTPVSPVKFTTFGKVGHFKADENKNLISCMRKSSDACSPLPVSPTRQVRLSMFTSAHSDNLDSDATKVERQRIPSAGSVFSNESKRSLLSTRYIPFLSRRGRSPSNTSVLSSNTSRSSCSSAISKKRKDSMVSGSSASSIGKRARMRRNTIVFGTISLVFVLSYLPCLVVVGMRTLSLYKVMSSPSVNSQVAEIFVRSGYLNSAINPFIYSFLCPTFRRGVKRLFTK